MDEELLKLLNQALELVNPNPNASRNKMKEQGIPMPYTPGDKPSSQANSVPMGMKMNDDEIANILAAKLLQSTKECSRSMMEAIRFDLGLIWANFYYEQAKLGATLKSKMRNRGWVKLPPPYHPPGSQSNLDKGPISRSLFFWKH